MNISGRANVNGRGSNINGRPTPADQPPIFKTVYPDSFDRANTSTGGAGTSTGAGNGWIDVQGGVAQINSNQLKLTADTSDTSQFQRDHVVRPSTENKLDQQIQADFPAQSWSTSTKAGLILRWTSAAKNCYLATFSGLDGSLAIYKIISGSPTALGTAGATPSFSQATNYTLRFAIEGSTGVLTFEVINKDTGLSVNWCQTADTSISVAGAAGFCAPFGAGAVVNVWDNVVVSSSARNVIGIIGDSISANVPPTGLKAPGASLARALGTRTRKEYTVSNQAITGKTSADWANDVGSILTTAKAAFASAGVTDVHILIGTNDSKTAVATTKAGYKANLVTLTSNLVSAGYRVFLSAPPWVDPGAYSLYDANSNVLILQYTAAIQEVCNGSTIILGDTQSYSYFKRFENQLTDHLHPTVDGGEAIADLWAEAIWRYFL